MIPENLTGRIRCTFKRKHPLTSKLLLVVQVEAKPNPDIPYDKAFWRDATIEDFTTNMHKNFTGFNIKDGIAK